MVAIGQTVSHYRILEKLGGGGMGVVYKAQDTVLDRPVALKVLSPEMLADPAAVRAFLREAKSASSLNHPNILTVHDLVEGNGVRFLVMEFVEGRTLRDLISRKGMEVKSLLNISLQVAEALAAAHKAGIIHRDLKPENIMVRSDGHAKVVDFGLAKLAAERERIAITTASLDSTIPLSALSADRSGLSAQESRIAGTLPYMSPEQLTGKALDARTDIFSFGVVLYEMTTAQQPFQGATTGELVQSILEKEPRPVSDLSRVAPEKLPEIVAKCLEKDPEERYQHIEDAVVDLRRLTRITGSAGRTVPAVVQDVHSKHLRTGRGRKLALAFVAGMALLGAVFAAWLLWPKPVPRVLKYTQITNDGQPKPDLVGWDGSRIYFMERMDAGAVLMEVPDRGGEVVRVPLPWKDASPIEISPDKTKLLLTLDTGAFSPPQLWVLPLVGGAPRRLSLGRAFGPVTWSPSGEELAFATPPPEASISTFKIDESSARTLVRLQGMVSCLKYSPDGQTILFNMRETESPQNLWEVSASGVGLRRVLDTEKFSFSPACGNWTPNGRYFVIEGSKQGEWARSLWVLREPGILSRQSDWEPVQVVAGPMSFTSPLAAGGGKTFAVGTLWRGELTRYDAASKQFVPFLSGIPAEGVDFSRDGKWISYVAIPEATLWRSRPDGSEKTQLTTPPLRAALPRWSPDGKQIAFAGRRPGEPWQVYTIPSDGGSPLKIHSSPFDEGDLTWSPDGNSITWGGVMGARQGAGSFEPLIRITDLRTREVTTVAGSPGEVVSPRWSPDGRYLIASDLASIKLLLYSFREKKWRDLVSQAGLRAIDYPNWSLEGSYIYYAKTTDSGSCFCRMRTRDWKEEEIVSLKGVKRASGEFGQWSGVTPDGSPLFLRDTGTQEIYALDVDFP